MEYLLLLGLFGAGARLIQYYTEPVRPQRVALPQRATSAPRPAPARPPQPARSEAKQRVHDALLFAKSFRELYVLAYGHGAPAEDDAELTLMALSPRSERTRKRIHELVFMATTKSPMSKERQDVINLCRAITGEA